MRLHVLCLTAAIGLSSGPAGAQRAPNGERVYAESCARCHDASIPLVPTRDALAAFTPEYIENSLSTFAMRSIGAGLSHAERRAVSEYVAGKPGSLPAPLGQIPASAYCRANPNVTNPVVGPSWNGWSPGLANSCM